MQAEKTRVAQADLPFGLCKFAKSSGGTVGFIKEAGSVRAALYACESSNVIFLLSRGKKTKNAAIGDLERRVLDLSMAALSDEFEFKK